MSSTTEIKEELDIIKQEDIDVLLNQPSEKERMEAAIENLQYQIEVKKYMEYWTKAWKTAMHAPPDEIPFDWIWLITLEEIPVPRNLEECRMTPDALAWKIEKEKRAEEEKDWPEDIRMID